MTPLLYPPRMRLAVVREPGENYQATPALCAASEVWSLYRTRAESLAEEEFWAVLCDNKRRIVADYLVARGSLTACIVHPREVLKMVLLSNAASFVLVHNHPSRDPTPSKEDLAITRRLRELGDLLGVPCVDHVIIGLGKYCSMVEDGYF